MHVLKRRERRRGVVGHVGEVPVEALAGHEPVDVPARGLEEEVEVLRVMEKREQPHLARN